MPRIPKSDQLGDRPRLSPLPDMDYAGARAAIHRHGAALNRLGDAIASAGGDIAASMAAKDDNDAEHAAMLREQRLDQDLISAPIEAREKLSDDAYNEIRSYKAGTEKSQTDHDRRWHLRQEQRRTSILKEHRKYEIDQDNAQFQERLSASMRRFSDNTLSIDEKKKQLEFLQDSVDTRVTSGYLSSSAGQDLFRKIKEQAIQNHINGIISSDTPDFDRAYQDLKILKRAMMPKAQVAPPTAKHGAYTPSRSASLVEGQPTDGRSADGTPSKSPIFYDRTPSADERREIFSKGGFVVNLDANWAKGDRQTTPMVVIPDEASPQQRAAAEQYAARIAQVYKEKFGNSLEPKVVTRSENGRGRGFTIHTEPYSVNDSKAVEFFTSTEGQRLHAQILSETFGKVPGVHFSLPHDPYRKGDNGAVGVKGINEVQLARGVLDVMRGNGDAPSETDHRSAFPPQIDKLSMARLTLQDIGRMGIEEVPGEVSTPLAAAPRPLAERSITAVATQAAAKPDAIPPDVREFMSKGAARALADEENAGKDWKSIGLPEPVVDKLADYFQETGVVPSPRTAEDVIAHLNEQLHPDKEELVLTPFGSMTAETRRRLLRTVRIAQSEHGKAKVLANIGARVSVENSVEGSRKSFEDGLPIDPRLKSLTNGDLERLGFSPQRSEKIIQEVRQLRRAEVARSALQTIDNDSLVGIIYGRNPKGLAPDFHMSPTDGLYSDMLRNEARKIHTSRSSDPVAAASRIPAVQKLYKETTSKGATSDNYRKYFDAVVSAQVSWGVSNDKIRLLTRDQAKRYYEKFSKDGLPTQDDLQKFSGLVKQLSSRIGEDYAIAIAKDVVEAAPDKQSDSVLSVVLSRVYKAMKVENRVEATPYELWLIAQAKHSEEPPPASPTQESEKALVPPEVGDRLSRFVADDVRKVLFKKALGTVGAALEKARHNRNIEEMKMLSRNIGSTRATLFAQLVERHGLKVAMEKFDEMLKSQFNPEGR